MGCLMQMTEAAFPSLVSKVSFDDYPTRPVTTHKAAPASPDRAPAQQQRQQAPAVREQTQTQTPRHNRHNATAAVYQQPQPQSQPQQRQAPVMSTPRPPPAQQPAQLPDPCWSSSGNSPSQSPRKQPPQKPQSLRSALPPGYMPQPRRVAQQSMTEQPAMTASSEHVRGMNRQSNGINHMPGGQPTCCNRL